MPIRSPASARTRAGETGRVDPIDQIDQIDPIDQIDQIDPIDQAHRSGVCRIHR